MGLGLTGKPGSAWVYAWGGAWVVGMWVVFFFGGGALYRASLQRNFNSRLQINDNSNLRIGKNILMNRLGMLFLSSDNFIIDPVGRILTFIFIKLMRLNKQ